MEAHDIRIRSLRLRGGPQEVAAARAGLTQALDSASWPSVPDDEVLVLRRIEVRGTAREIVARAAQRVSMLAAEAVRPEDPRIAQATAVRFRSRPALKARLLLDLASGQAGSRWYWREWQPLFHLPLADALVKLFEAEILDLPAVLMDLHHQPLWSDWWRILDEPAAQRLLGALGAALGTTHGIGSEVRGGAHPPAAELAPIPESIVDLASRPIGWLPPLPVGLPARSSRARLAALLRLLQWTPAILKRADAGDTLHALALALTTRMQPHRPDQPPAAPRPTPSGAPEVWSTGGAALAAVSAAVSERATPPAQPADERVPVAQPRTSDHAAERREERAVAADAVLAAGAAVPEPWLEDGCITAQGGAFYLLNFLALSSVQDKLSGHDLPGAGWRWLLSLMRAFGVEPDAALAQFMAIQCGLTQGSDLALLPSPLPGPQAQELLAQALRRYGEEAVQASFGLVPARLLHSPTHVDVHLRMDDIRLPVRRAGLDVNPGWLPWLGRVVTFHYGSGREPGMAWRPGGGP